MKEEVYGHGIWGRDDLINGTEIVVQTFYL
jgi:hypothetical protein